MEAKKVLIVDDSSTIRSLVGIAVKDKYALVEAVDGKDGLVQVEKHKDLSLIICDVNMPNMNGLEMIEHLRKSNQCEHIPIIMFTTESTQEMIDRGKVLGVKGWLVKPLSPVLLLGIINKIVDKNQG